MRVAQGPSVAGRAAQEMPPHLCEPVSVLACGIQVMSEQDVRRCLRVKLGNFAAACFSALFGFASYSIFCMSLVVETSKARAFAWPLGSNMW